MQGWRFVIGATLMLSVSCRLKQSRQDSGNDGEPIAAQERLSLAPPSFSGVAQPIGFTVAATAGACVNSTLPMRAPSDDLGGWNPANGNLLIEAPAGYGLSFFYHTTVPFQSALWADSGATNATTETQSYQTYTWQSNLDAELSPLTSGLAGTFSLRTGDGKETRFGVDGIALDGSGSYVTETSSSERRVYHRDEEGSYDVYRAVPYHIQTFDPYNTANASACVTVPSQTGNKCGMSVALRFLYAGSGRATDGVMTTRIVRNAVGRVTNVYNHADAEVLRINYAGTSGALATLPVSVMGPAEIGGKLPPRVSLQWNGKGFPLLSKISYKNTLNQNVILSYDYNDPFPAVSSTVRGMMASFATTIGDATASMTTLELVGRVSGPRPPVIPGAILKITTGTFGTKFVYELDDNAPVKYNRVRIFRWVKTPHDDSKVDSSEIIYLDKTVGCKLVQYYDPAGDYVRLQRNPDDFERVDAVANKVGNLNTAVGVVRRGGTDVNRKFDVMGIYSTELGGMNNPKLDVQYTPDPVSGAILEEIPLGEGSFRTSFEYDDRSLKPAKGVRLVKIRQFTNDVETAWAERKFDSNKRLESVTIDNNERAHLSYDSLVNGNQPLKVTISDPSKPVDRPVKIEVSSYGDVKEYLDQSGMTFKQEIDSMQRLRQVQGYGVSDFDYDPEKPLRLSTVKTDGDELSIEQPSALQSKLKFKNKQGATFQSTRDFNLKPNGLPDSAGGNGMRFFSDFKSESQY